MAAPLRLAFEHERDDPRQNGVVAGLEARHAHLLDEENPDVVVVVGGDGAMLRAIRRRMANADQPWRTTSFLGIGRGSVNFLMNPESAAEALGELDPHRLSRQHVHPLFVSLNGMAVGAASNDLVFGAGVMGWHSFRLDSSDGSFEDYRLKGCGLCVSTPIGSTAFNANNGGAVLPLDLPLMSITGVVANRDLNEIFAGDRLAISYESRTPLGLHLDGCPPIELGREGRVELHRDPQKHLEILFLDGSEFARRRIDLLKAKRK